MQPTGHTCLAVCTMGGSGLSASRVSVCSLGLCPHPHSEGSHRRFSGASSSICGCGVFWKRGSPQLLL